MKDHRVISKRMAYFLAGEIVCFGLVATTYVVVEFVKWISRMISLLP